MGLIDILVIELIVVIEASLDRCCNGCCCGAIAEPSEELEDLA